MLNATMEGSLRPGWAVKRIGDLMQLTNGYPFDSGSFGPDGDFPLVRIRDLFAKEYSTYVSGPVPPSAVLRDGDIVIGMDGDFEGVLWQRGPAALNQRMCLLRPGDGVDARFIAYALPKYLKVINDLTYATTVKHLSSFDVLAIRLPIPDHTRQRAIADHLDGEAARIDALIAARSRQLDLLAERLRALRDHRLESQDAEHRRVSHLLLTPISDGPHETPEFVDEGIPFLSVDNVVDDRLSFAGCRHISLEAHLRYARKSSPLRGDVLITKAAAVGRVGLVETDEPFSVWSPLAILRPDPEVVLPEYLQMTLLGTYAQSLMQLAATSNTQQNISMRDLAAIRLPIPSLADQAAAIRSFQSDAALIGIARTALRRQLGLLHERRQAVIDAVVSGQLEISGVAA